MTIRNNEIRNNAPVSLEYRYLITKSQLQFLACDKK
jgi:hypothetical protein